MLRRIDLRRLAPIALTAHPCPLVGPRAAPFFNRPSEGVIVTQDAAFLDAQDALASFRDEFAIPRHQGQEVAYFCGNSLGLMPKAAAGAVSRVLDQWANYAVEAHFTDADAWMPYHALVREALADLAGARPMEVVAMNTLTTNLHLMMASFYRPTAQRRKILIEARAFPSDRHAVASQIVFHGGDIDRDLIEIAPEPGSHLIEATQIEALLAREGESIALVLMPGVQYATGQRFDLKAIASLGARFGCKVGFDLAHAMGNVPVDLHDSGADFAVWCSYKYLNAGPGAIAGCFVHDRHAHSDLPRFAGWWGHRQDTRFLMGPTFEPTPGVEGWQLSNPSIFALAPLRASLAIFQRAGLTQLRAKSIAMTRWLAAAVNRDLAEHIEILTPSDAEQRGCQLSMRMRAGRAAGRQVFEDLAAAGIICDWREPDVIRASPVPLYNRFSDCERLVEGLRSSLRAAA